MTLCRSAEDPEHKVCEFSGVCHESRQQLAQQDQRRGMDCTWFVMIVQKLAYDPPEEKGEAAA